MKCHKASDADGAARDADGAARDAMRRLTLALQLSLVVVFAAFTGWTVGVVKLVEVLMTAEGGRFATASEQRAETFLVSFGVSKALCNGLAGWLADARGRRAAMLVGWAAALALAPAVLFAQSWSLVVAADCLLGANQAFNHTAVVVTP